jgi:hypothetical protein
LKADHVPGLGTSLDSQLTRFIGAVDPRVVDFDCGAALRHFDARGV